MDATYSPFQKELGSLCFCQHSFSSASRITCPKQWLLQDEKTCGAEPHEPTCSHLQSREQAREINTLVTTMFVLTCYYSKAHIPSTTLRGKNCYNPVTVRKGRHVACLRPPVHECRQFGLRAYALRLYLAVIKIDHTGYYRSSVNIYRSRGPSQPRDRTQVSCTVGRFFTS